MTDLDLSSPRSVHIVGIGGAGMSAIATVLRAMGHRVSGSDLKDSSGLARLRSLGIDVHVGHRAEHVPDGVDAVTISTAVPPTNPEVQEAEARSIPVLRRAEALAAICATRRTIAVAGTHGKTTTSSMLAVVLIEAGLRPSFIIGGEVNEIGTGAAWDEGEWFVVEADESDGTFLELGAEAVIVTSIEPDHLDHYGSSYDTLIDAFRSFVAEASGPRVLCADYPVAADIARELGAVTYGFAAGADFRISSAEGARTGVRFEVDDRGTIALPIPGRHNAANATAAVAMAMQIGVPFDVAARALAKYGGVARRFQFRGERDGVTFVDDYAHLPGEVASALQAAKDGGWRRVVCVFQPHRYSRTAQLWPDFATAFDDADVLVVTDIYSAGEQPRPGITGKLVVDAVTEARPGKRVAWFPSRSELARHVRQYLRPGDLCITLGAGDLTTLADELIAAP